MSTATKRLPLIDLPIGQHKRGLGLLQGSNQRLLPLSHVDISAKVADRVASVQIRQVFRNTYSEHIEAVYVFPLSGGCVVSQFELHVGDRVVKGLVKERQLARQQYQQALADGKRAALLEQERDDIFTMQVGNIPPDETITVLLTYSERLPFFENGKTELRLPLVVPPRYVGGTPLARPSVGSGTEADTDAVPDASRISPPLLAKGFDPKVALQISVELDQFDKSGSSEVSELTCSQHATQLALETGLVRVELAREDEKLDRDFVLSWRLASKVVKSSFLLHCDPAGEQFGMLSIVPPRRDGFLGAPRDVVFVLDRSGSMNGIKMQSAARACSLLLHTLGPADRFAIQAFDNLFEWMLPNRATSRNGCFYDADEQNVDNGDKFLRTIEARGGTELESAVANALAMISARSDADKRIPILVLITDGEVGNEAQVLKRIQYEVGDTRVFTVGVDTAVNTGLLKRMANLGGGTATFVAPGTDLERALKSVGREIGEPVITDLQLTGSDGTTIDRSMIAPSDIPDLFAGRAATVFFKLSGTGSVRVRGRWSDGKPFDEKIKPCRTALAAISQLWAKAHISDLEDAFRLTPNPTMRQNIIAISERHSILTKFTAFVAVDEAEIVNKDGRLQTVVQPVEEPAFWGMFGQAPDTLLGVAAPAQALLGASPAFGAPACAAPSMDAAALKPMRRARATDSDQVQSSSWTCAEPSDWGAAGEQRGSSADSQAASQTANASGASAAGFKHQVVKPTGAQPPSAASAAPPGAGQNISAYRAPGDRGNQLKGGFAGPSEQQRNVCALLTEKIAQLTQLLQDCLALLKTGQLPDAEPLEKLRKELLDAMTVLDAATEIPAMQRFLRVQLKELVQSLHQQGVKAAELLPLWERYHSLFHDAQAETTNLLAGSSSSSDGAGRFWEQSV